ncbi:MAG: outer membrane beta-barrel protein [Acidobacteriota bacterium]
MRKTFIVFFAALLVVGLSAPSAEAQRPAKNTFEITPFAAFYLEGNFEDGFDRDDFFDDDLEVDEGEGYGIALGFGITRQFMLELSWTQQETELIDDRFFGPDRFILPLDVEYIHVNGLFQWPLGQLQPYVLLGAGVTRFEPSVGGFDDESRFSFGVGGGIKAFVTDHIGFRLQGRILGTFIDEDEDVFCDRFDFCYVYDDETYLYQAEASAGLIFAF